MALPTQIADQLGLEQSLVWQGRSHGAEEFLYRSADSPLLKEAGGLGERYIVGNGDFAVSSLLQGRCVGADEPEFVSLPTPDRLKVEAPQGALVVVVYNARWRADGPGARAALFVDGQQATPAVTCPDGESAALRTGPKGLVSEEPIGAPRIGTYTFAVGRGGPSEVSIRFELGEETAALSVGGRGLWAAVVGSGSMTAEELPPAA